MCDRALKKFPITTVEDDSDTILHVYRTMNVSNSLLQDLMKCINEDFPAGTNLSHLEREQEAHDAFAEARRRVYIGRQEYFDYIDNYFVKSGKVREIVL